MKTIIILITCAFSIPLFCNAQQPMYFSEVVKVDSTTNKEELFSRARSWFSSHYIDSKAALDVQDKETGELLGNGSMDVMAIQTGSNQFPYGIVTYNFKIIVKDGRYKYEFSNFIHKQVTYELGYIDYGLLTTSTTAPEGKRCPLCGDKINNKCWNSIRENVIKKMESHIASLKSEMLQNIGAKKEEW